MCCIGNYGVQPIIEFYTAADTKINSAGFAQVSVENTGQTDAKLDNVGVTLEQGDKECFGIQFLPLVADIEIAWPSGTSALSGKLKVIKYKIIELCPPQK